MKKIISLGLSVITLSILLSGCSQHETKNKASSNVTSQNNKRISISKTYEYHLKNGLTLLVTPDNRAPVVISQIWYKIGSIHEPEGLTGISHMLEHMMFKGTTKYELGMIEDIVLNNGGQQNAFTSHDYTAYYQYWGNDKLEKSFQIESSRMSDLILDQALFDKEKQVVMEERRMRIEDNPSSYAYEELVSLANNPNPIHHPVIGWMDDIKTYKLSDLDEWYSSYYAPNNATIVVVGDIKPKEVYSLVKKYFSRIKPSSEIPHLAAQKNLISSGKKQLIVRRPNVQVPILFMSYNVPSVTTATQSWEPYALMVLDSIVADNPSSRLSKELVREKELATSISSSYNPFSISQSMFTLIAIPKHDTDVNNLENSIEEQLELIKKSGITKIELEREKRNMIADKVYSLDSIPGQATMLGSFVSIGMKKEDTQQYLNKILAVTAAQVNYVARQYIQDNNLTVVTLLPEKSPKLSLDKNKTNIMGSSK